jgi:homogentisate 1,2-dioxygenase
MYIMYDLARKVNHSIATLPTHHSCLNLVNWHGVTVSLYGKEQEELKAVKVHQLAVPASFVLTANV